MLKRLSVMWVMLLFWGCHASTGVAPMPQSNPGLADNRQELTVTPSITATTGSPTLSPSPVIVPSPTATTLPRDPSPTPSTMPSVTATTLPTDSPTTTPPVAQYQFPIGWPDRPAGDGFFIRHSVVSENTWYNPGYWHTGEDWYAIDGTTAGAEIYAVAAGEVVFVGANYPGRVVIIRHDDSTYSMYGHLDPAVVVEANQTIERGTQLGNVLHRTDSVPDHLHFEIRTFLTTPAVNGSNPRYAFRCGPNCPPGPGYWPIDATDLPGDIGWYNPTHLIAGRMFAPDASEPLGEVIVAAEPVSSDLTLWSAPPPAEQQILGDLVLQPGNRYALRGIQAGPEAARGTSAEAYQLWYQIELPDGRNGWVQAITATTFETGSDGRPATIRFHFWPVTPPTFAALPSELSDDP